MRSIHLCNLLHILLIQFDLQTLEITLNPLLIDALGHNTRPPLDPPRQRHLRTITPVFLCDLCNNWMFHQRIHFCPGIVNVVLVSKGGVRRDFDALLLVPVDKGLLLQVGVCFELVDCRFVFGYFDEIFEFLFGEVGDSDGFDLAGVEQLFHGCPGLIVRSR